MTTAIEDPLIPLRDAAKTLGISVHAAYKRVSRNGRLHPLLPTLVTGGTNIRPRLFVSRFELEDLAQARERHAARSDA